jgi:formylglycine-generating enzyme required for sulfatase activity
MLKKSAGFANATMYSVSDGWAATAEVGRFPRDASPFGVLDMAGNVSELTADRYGEYRAEAVTDPQRSRSSESPHVSRGGSWFDNDPHRVRAAYRTHLDPDLRNFQIGFRCARGAKP